MSAELVTQLLALATAREEAASADDAVKRAKAAFTLEHAQILSAQKAAASVVTAIEDRVRTISAAAHTMTGAKKPAPGIEMKTYKQYSILDPAQALEWSRASRIGHIPESFDPEAILRVAKTTNLPFILYGEEVRAAIATSLDVGALTRLAGEFEAVQRVIDSPDVVIGVDYAKVGDDCSVEVVP